MTTTQLPEAVLPAGPTSPRLLQGLSFAFRRSRTLRKLRARYGSAFTMRTLNFGTMVMLADPAEVKQLFQAAPEDVDKPDTNLGAVLGPGSLFAITGEAHRQQRKLLTPPFHGRRL